MVVNISEFFVVNFWRFKIVYSYSDCFMFNKYIKIMLLKFLISCLLLGDVGEGSFYYIYLVNWFDVSLIVKSVVNVLFKLWLVI